MSAGQLHHRALGGTGIRTSVLGLGSSPFRHGEPRDWSRLVEQAFDLGIDYYDTARSYVNGEEVLAQIPKDVRNRLVVTTKTGARGGSYCLRDLQSSLRTMNRSFIDVWMAHLISTEEEYEMCTALGGFCDIAIAARRAGLIRATGASFHASTELVLRAIDERAFDVVMFPFNVIGRETVFGSSIASYRDKLLPAAVRNGVGVVVMKVLAGGELAHGARKLEFLADKSSGRSVIGGAIRSVILHPAIATAVIGVSNQEQLCENVTAIRDAKDDSAEALAWMRAVAEVEKGECTRCGLCIGACPEGIEIPKVFRLFDQARFFGMYGVARYKYGLMQTNGSACTECSNCQEVCPEDFDIPMLLHCAHTALTESR